MLGWRRFLWVVFGGFFGVLALLSALVLLMNPYGNLPQLVFNRHVITDGNQRFQYPALIRSGDFDSFVIGTSDARLLRPALLDRVLGGRFANLAMDDARAWEQYQLADLFMRQASQPRMLLVALDHVWCYPDALTSRTTRRGFPVWMYDENPWNDLPFMLNGQSVEISVRRLAVGLGLKAPRFVAGYEVFTPPESEYNRRKVRQKLWGNEGPRSIRAVDPPYKPTAAERAAWQFPALDWLDEILGRFPGRKVLAFMPIHVVAQPNPGSAAAAEEAECKARIAEIAQRHGAAPIIDFRIASDITTTDDNYWDPLHYREAVADRVVKDIGLALSGEKNSNGDWRYLGEQSVAANSPTH